LCWLRAHRAAAQQSRAVRVAVGDFECHCVVNLSEGFSHCMREQKRGGRRHKDLQLCRQVHDALSYALTEFVEPELEKLTLIAVEPAPSAARLLVTFTMPSNYQNPTAVIEQRDRALATLRTRAADIRDEVTAEITRKRAPELVFRIVTDEEVRAELAP